MPPTHEEVKRLAIPVNDNPTRSRHRKLGYLKEMQRKKILVLSVNRIRTSGEENSTYFIFTLKSAEKILLKSI